MTCYLEVETDIDLGIPCQQLLERCLEAVMDAEACPFEAQVEVVITDNASIHEVNKEFRGVDAPTDVLSFPMIEYEEPSDFDWLEEADEYFHPDTGELMLGDMMISAERVIEQAQAYGHSIEREFAFLTVHSLLHLCGYDHMTPEEEQEMIAKQEFILNQLGITRD